MLTRSGIVLLATACVPMDLEPAEREVDPPLQPADLPFASLPPPQPFSLQVTELVQGRTAEFKTRRGQPGASVYFLRGGSGAGTCLPSLGGHCLGISSPSVLGIATADAWGIATLLLPISTTAPLTTTRLQAADPNGSSPYLSDVEPRAFLPPRSTYRLGNFDHLDGTTQMGAAVLYAVSVQVPDDVTVTGIGLRAANFGQQAKLALYDDAGGAPGALLTATGPFLVPAVGPFEVSTPTRVAIPSGQYWITIIWESTGTLRHTRHTGEEVHYAYMPFSSPHPTTFPTPVPFTAQEWEFALWLVVN